MTANPPRLRKVLIYVDQRSFTAIHQAQTLGPSLTARFRVGTVLRVKPFCICTYAGTRLQNAEEVVNNTPVIERQPLPDMNLENCNVPAEVFLALGGSAKGGFPERKCLIRQPQSAVRPAYVISIQADAI